MKLARIIPWAAAALALAAAVARLAPGAPGPLPVAALGRLPVLEGGRVKPLDSVARNALLSLSGRQDLADGDRTVEPTEWLLDVMFRSEVSDRQALLLVDDPELLGLLRLDPGPRRRAPREIAPRVGELQRVAAAAERVPAAARGRFERAALLLVDRLQLYVRLRTTMQAGRPLALELAEPAAPGAAERRAALSGRAAFRGVPPAPGGDEGSWRSTGEALGAWTAGERDAALAAWARVGLAWRARGGRALERAAAELDRAAASGAPAAASRSRLEVLFNRAQPFVSGMAIYLLALFLACASWALAPAVLRPTAVALAATGALVHTAGLAARILLQGRPPVTNLYSSAVFVGWVAVWLGVLLERVHRRGFGVAVAGAAGFSTLLVAQHLGGSGDTLEMMRAVLDSNFWLSTHVVAITAGYAGTFVAGALAIGWTVRNLVVRAPDPVATRALVSGIYGVLCFSLLFTFLGTVLGGIWADQSWGRFWGWDPKENGALLIVLWIAITLHARLGGHIRERGLAAMAIGGNVVTSLSWFGVNMLGVGLHSYGFMDRAFPVLAAFVLSQLALAGLAIAPRRAAAVAAPVTAAAALAASAPARGRRPVTGMRP